MFSHKPGELMSPAIRSNNNHLFYPNPDPLNLDGTSRTIPRVDLVQHQVDDYPRHTNIKPKWESPSRNEAVLVKFFQPGAAQGNQDQRHDHNHQQGVRNQEREVNRADSALPLKYHMSHAVVINQVGSQKNSGDAEGGNHEVLMHIPLSCPDRGVAPGQQNGADS